MFVLWRTRRFCRTLKPQKSEADREQSPSGPGGTPSPPQIQSCIWFNFQFFSPEIIKIKVFSLKADGSEVTWLKPVLLDHSQSFYEMISWEREITWRGFGGLNVVPTKAAQWGEPVTRRSAQFLWNPGKPGRLVRTRTTTILKFALIDTVRRKTFKKQAARVSVLAGEL